MLQFADQIMVQLEECIEKKELESFFLPGSNLLCHKSYTEDYRAVLYARLLRAMLHSPSESTNAWPRLAQALAAQLVKPANLRAETFEQDLTTLFDFGLKSTHRFSNGYSLLYYMITHNIMNGVTMLLERQTFLDNVDGRNTTALCLAMENNATSILQLLQETCSGKIHSIVKHILFCIYFRMKPVVKFTML